MIEVQTIEVPPLELDFGEPDDSPFCRVVLDDDPDRDEPGVMTLSRMIETNIAECRSIVRRECAQFVSQEVADRLFDRDLLPGMHRNYELLRAKLEQLRGVTQH